ncbi:MAG: GerW family sporulation protein [Clostridia bacterium]|nr:GerW family sporulation protein [Clostridia bacterium]
MSDRPIEGLMDTTLEKIKQMVDVNTVIGDAITTPDGTTIIPVSKVIYGFASGGSEFGSKKMQDRNLFGGGAGAGVTITPVAFISIHNGDVKLLNISDYQNSGDRAIAMVPELFDKIVALFKKDKSADKKSSDTNKDQTDINSVDVNIEDPKV